MKEIKSQNFEDLYLENGEEISDISFQKCTFSSCFFSSRISPQTKLSIISNSIFQNCKLGYCEVGEGIFDNVEIENLKNSDILDCSGTKFNKVVLKGRFDRIVIGCSKNRPANLSASRMLSHEEQKFFEQLFKQFYLNIEFALDIRAAEFKECQISDIPPNKILINNHDQVVIFSQQLNDNNWKDNKHIPISFKLAFKNAMENSLGIVLVAPKRDKSLYKKYMEGFHMLRQEGFIY